jgi:ATP-binding cassette subfamily F protein uup
MLLSMDAVTKTLGTSMLLEGVSLGLDQGDRIGVVGRNGAGKSTLLRVLAGLEPPDAGRVVRRGGTRVGMLTQGDELDPKATIGDCVVGGRETHDWAADAASRDVLDGLGLRHRLEDRVANLSGGERRRVALARLLLGDDEVMLLDEPTNHLDLDGVAWLAGHLAKLRRALLMVTHDRWFLDAVCDHTWEVGGGSVSAYDGGYSAYVLAKAERERQTASNEARRQNLLRKELAWLRRGPPARTSKPQFRIDAANALIEAEPPARDSMVLRRTAVARLGRDVLDVEDVSLAYGARTLLNDVTWRIGPGDRIGLVGVNGSGKTTLLRLLTDEQPADSGRVKRGKTVRLGYLSQHVAELDGTLRVLEALEEVGRVLPVEGGRELTAGQLLEQFGFAATRQWTPVSALSGGERRRLQILRLLLSGANVLLLDEPTNDLDVETLRAFEDVLDGWPGTIIVVSHDRYFLERVTDSIVALTGGGSLDALPGGVEQFIAERVATSAVSAPAPAKSGAKTGDARATAKELIKLERAVQRLSKREAELHAQMAEAATDHEKVLVLDTELRSVGAEREAAEERWLELAEEIG